MSVPVSFNELFNACEWVTSAEQAVVTGEAYIERATGKISWCGDGIDEEAPEDVDDGSLYLAVPRRRELDLGRQLALRFVEEHMPEHLDRVHGFFRKRGAYGQLKSLLAREDQLDAWHAYEHAATRDAMQAWCEANGFQLVD